MMRASSLVAAVALASCTVSEDPADGGFVSGVAGISQGTYEDRIEDREAEIARLQGEYSRLQRELASRRAAVAAQGVAVPPELDAEINSALQPPPSGGTDAERLERYRRAVSDARRLTDQLAQL